MRELLLTHLFDRTAVIALVDYEKYTVSVKKLDIEDPSLETGDLSELMKSGKLKLYRSKELLDLRRDAWLAYDPDRGCLAVNCYGEVINKPASEYFANLAKGTGYYRRETTDRTYKPKLLGNQPTSFYKTLKEIEKKHGSSIKDPAVQKEVMDRTGIKIEYSAERTSWTSYESCNLNLYGQTIDRFDMSADTQTITLNLDSGHIEMVWLDGPEKVSLNASEMSSAGILKISHRVKELMCRYLHGNDCIHPELTTDAENCALESLIGYNRFDADLSAFKNLKHYTRCWTNSNSSYFEPLNLILNDREGKEFRECFTGVDIKTLIPHADGSGTLDLTGISDITQSFLRFTGVSFISGVVAGDVTGSFLSEEFNGKFEVTVRDTIGSFGYRIQARHTYSSTEKTPPKYKPEGIVKIEAASHEYPKGDKRGWGELTLGSSGKDSVDYWKQEHHLHYQGGKVRKLYISLDKDIDFHVHAPVAECSVSGGWSLKSEEKKDPVFNSPVSKLTRGSFPYPNVADYDDKCFANTHFRHTHTCVIPEGVESIGARAFYSTSGLDYIVVPKSCISIGAAAFSEAKSGTSDLSVICVYRDTYGHRWSKGKNLKIKVIDSLDDIPKPTSTKTEGDFLAAFVDTPVWADKSKPFVAKLLTMGTADLMAYIKPVSSLSGDIVKFFNTEYNSKERTKTDKGGNIIQLDLATKGADGPCPDGHISRYLLHAGTLQAIYGSNTDLLDIEVLSRFNWTPTRCFGVMLWEGSPKIDSFYGGKGRIRIYLKDNEVYYVGCGYLYEQRLSVDTSPQEVLSVDTLIGPDVEGRLTVGSAWASKHTSVKVHGEDFKDDARARFVQFLHDGMVYLEVSEAASSGRIRIKEHKVYDIVNDKIYKFSATNEDLGTYRGEVSKDKLREISGFNRSEEACLAEDTVKISKAEVAPPAFELEYCRKNPPFDLYGQNPRVDSFIKLLSKSGLVRKATQSTFENRLAPYTSTHKLLADGTILEAGKTAGGYTYMIGFRHKGKFYGFEAAFDFLKFIDLMDSRIQGLKAYPNPESGYLNLTNDADLFAVTPVPVLSDYYSDNRKQRQTGIFMAFDLMSGKLVLAYGDTYDTCVICSFASAKDARKFYTDFGSKLFALPDSHFASSFKSSIYIHTEDDQRSVVSMHPHSGSERITNSLLALGGREHLPSHTKDKSVFSETILRYGRI